MPKKQPTHGGSRTGAGRPPKPDAKNVSKSIKVSKEVADYLAEKGTGIIELMVRNSHGFRTWK
jgi:hypothetical protein